MTTLCFRSDRSACNWPDESSGMQEQARLIARTTAPFWRRPLVPEDVAVKDIAEWLWKAPFGLLAHDACVGLREWDCSEKCRAKICGQRANQALCDTCVIPTPSTPACHNCRGNPRLFEYGNQMALELFETDFEELAGTPSTRSADNEVEVMVVRSGWHKLPTKSATLSSSQRSPLHPLLRSRRIGPRRWRPRWKRGTSPGTAAGAAAFRGRASLSRTQYSSTSCRRQVGKGGNARVAMGRWVCPCSGPSVFMFRISSPLCLTSITSSF